MTHITGKVYILGTNIDTDQIIPAQFLNLVPTVPEEYAQLGSHALAGLPEPDPPFIADGELKTEYSIIIAGANFGCGSSREHAPVALGAAGVAAVVAPSFARIFYRNCIATGELYPLESHHDLTTVFKTGDDVSINLDTATLTRITDGTTHSLLPLGDARTVIDAGGIFSYARAEGMISH